MNPEKPERPKPKKHYTEEFRRSVVDHWLSSGKTCVGVAKEFGVHAWNLRDWKRRLHWAAKPVDAPVPKTPNENGRGLPARPAVQGIGKFRTARFKNPP